MHNFYDYIVPYDEYITGNSFINICEETNQTFCKTDYIIFFSNKQVDVFITHNSDYHITNQIVSLGPKYRRWYTQNKDVVNDNIHSIPIGIENTKLIVSDKSHNGLFSSQVNGALYKSQLINKFSNLNLKKDKLVYLNFNVNTYPIERQYVMDMFKNESWVTHTNNLSIEQFYNEVAQHKFIFSPRGNGVDCHRTWEALYLGVIPIVKKSIHMNEFSDLPILFIDNWSDVNEKMLHNFYEQVKDTSYNLDKLKISYWKNIIKNS